MYFQAKPVKLPKGCNFPGCKCNKYRAAQVPLPSQTA